MQDMILYNNTHELLYRKKERKRASAGGSRVAWPNIIIAAGDI